MNARDMIFAPFDAAPAAASFDMKFEHPGRN